MKSNLKALIAILIFLGSMPTASLAQNVMFIVDFSGSMNERMGGPSKIAVAKQEFRNAVTNLPPTARVGLVAFGHRSKSCGDIEVVSRFGQQTPLSLADRVDALQARGETPIANALFMGFAEFGNHKGEANSIVL